MIVDPFLVPIPKRYLENKLEREYHERLVRSIDQLRQRTGGSTDNIQENSTRESYPWVLEQPRVENINLNHETSNEEVHYHYSSVMREFRGVTVTSIYTAAPWDWIKAKSRSKVIFPRYPEDGAEIIVANGDGTEISLDGNGRNINGSSTGKIRLRYTSIRFKYFTDDNEWLAI